jgi:ABC-type multidrug transport system fused ATPase/permease subunit
MQAKNLKKNYSYLKNVVSSVVWCLSLSWNASKRYTLIRMCAGIIIPLFSILSAFLGKHIIDLLTKQNDYSTKDIMIVYLLLATFFVSLTRMIIQKSEQYISSIHGEIINKKLALLVMNYSLTIDLEYFDNSSYHDKLMAASNDSYAISYMVWNAMGVVASAITLLSALAILFNAYIPYGLVMLIAAIPASFVGARYTKELYELSLEQINGQRLLGYHQAISINRGFAQDIRLFNAGSMLLNKYQNIWDSLFIKRRNKSYKRTIFTILCEFLPETVMAWVGVDITFKVLAGLATIGDYSLYIGLVGQLWSTISMFSSSALNIYDNQMRINNFKSIESFKSNVKDIGSRVLEKVDSISINNVTFTYPGTSIPVLRKINIEISKNEKVALVGLNGSGKSTIIKLLLRLYAPDAGSILINNINIEDYTLESLRSQFSVYFQDMLNFSFSIQDNFTITDYKENNTEDEEAIKDSLLKAECQDILSKCKGRFDMNLTRLFSTDGIELSGGQHQKLALARVLYRRSTALILDEPSSNLDPKAEHLIFERLKKMSEDKLTIFTSHRLSNVFLANRIIVLEKGCIIEDGTQEELLKNKHRYAELFKYQQEKYIV